MRHAPVPSSTEIENDAIAYAMLITQRPGSTVTKIVTAYMAAFADCLEQDERRETESLRTGLREKLRWRARSNDPSLRTGRT